MYEIYSSVTRSPHDLENFTLIRWDFVSCSRKGHPGIVGYNGVFFGEARPEVEQDYISSPNRTVLLVRWFIMRITGVRIDCYVRRITENQSRVLYKGCKPLRHAIFIECYICS